MLKPPADTRIVFLDIDGVLNHRAWWEANPYTTSSADLREHALRSIDPAAVERVNVLCERTGAVVVVSSTWRGAMLKVSLGLRPYRRFEIIDRTPSSRAAIRGHEIQQWLDRHEVAAEQCVILDDDSDMVHLLPRLVLTSREVGFTDEHLERAVALLGEVPRG